MRNDAVLLKFTDRHGQHDPKRTARLSAEYNSQVAVDSEEQIILAHPTAATQNDAPMLPPCVEQIALLTGASPVELSADICYISEANLEGLKQHGARACIASGREEHGTHAAVRLGIHKGTRI